MPTHSCVLHLLVHLATAIGALSLCSPSHAQDVIYLCDSTTDSVLRIVDADNNGNIDPLLELSLFYDDSSDGPDLSTPNHLLSYQGSVLLSDGGTLDAILRLTDLNDDGDANDPGEVTPFYDDSAPGLDLSSPNCLALAPDGSLFVSDDGASVRAILHITDFNNDGDALDDGELVTFYDTTALSPTDPIFDPESVAISDDGIVYVGDSTSGFVYRLEDLNADGDALDANEASIYYSVAAGVAVTDIDALQIDGNDLFIIDEDNGTVLRVHDDNGDGDALDTGEFDIYLDGSFSSDPNDALLYQGGLLLADGALDGIAFAIDSNGNGVATDPGEIALFLDGAGVISTPSGIAVESGPTIDPAPELSTVTPNSGPEQGGTGVTLTGMHLNGTFEVLFGTVAGIILSVSDTSLLVSTPPGSGTISITVTSNSGSATLFDSFEYLTTANLSLSDVTPAIGTTVGGTQLTLTGSGWDTTLPLEVTIDGSTATIVDVTATTITVTSPAHDEATVDIAVTQAGNDASLAQAYQYLTPFLRGDANRSAQLELNDAIILLYYIFSVPGVTATCFDALDVDDNASIAVDDALILLNYLFQSGPPPAAPFPGIGFDPTPGDPGCSL